MHLYVGLSAQRGSLGRFAFDLLELPISSALPKPKTLRQMREQHPATKFSIRLDPAATNAPLEPSEVARITAARQALGAQVIVIPTGSRFAPTVGNRQTLAALADQLRGEECLLGWEPRGLWTAEEQAALCEELGLLSVGDLTRVPAPPGPVVYTRLLALGLSARISQHAQETLCANLEGKQTAYVVVQQEGARATRAALRQWFELEDA